MSVLSFINWAANPEIMPIGPLSLRWYGLLFALGFVVGYQIMVWIFNNEKKNIKDLEALTISMILGTVLGARLGHCLFYEPAYYLANPLEILKVWQGGLASHGATIGIVIALFIFVKKKKGFTMLWTLDRIALVTALAGAFIRIGNFFNSEILGSPADLPWAVVFQRVDMIPRHPAQLYEAMSYLIIFAILFIIYNRKRAQTPQGLLIGIFFATVFGARFVIEFFKEVQTGWELGLPLHMGQLLSLPLVLAGLWLIYKSLMPIKKA